MKLRIKEITTRVTPITAVLVGGEIVVDTESVSAVTAVKEFDVPVVPEGPPPIPPDTTAPSVAIVSPTGGTVAGNVTVTATATDNSGVGGVLGVQFKVNGVNFGPEDGTAPYAITWDTQAVQNGVYVLTAVARDASGNQATSAPVSVAVNNVVIPVPPPTPPPDHVRTFFLSPTGNDGNSGTQDAPWRTIWKAMMSTGPGDLIYMRGGTYGEALEMRGDPGNRFGKTMGGSPAGWWTLAGFDGEPVIFGSGDFSTNSIQYCRFQNITFINGQNFGVRTASWISGALKSHHIQIVNNTFNGTQPRYGFMEVGFDDSLVEGCEVVCTGGGTTTDHGIYLHNGERNVVRNNRISGVSGYGIHAYDERKGSSDPQTFFRDVIIENNVCSGSRLRAGLIAATGGDTQIQSMILRNNITYANATDGIKLAALGSQNILGVIVVNNTVNEDIQIQNAKMAGCEIRNNIALGGIGGLSSGVIASNNMLTGNPQFVSVPDRNYHLQATSPTRGQGITMPVAAPVDKDGVTRPIPACDLGAYQFVE